MDMPIELINKEMIYGMPAFVRLTLSRWPKFGEHPFERTSALLTKPHQYKEFLDTCRNKMKNTTRINIP
jgi:hypothetical protein